MSELKITGNPTPTVGKAEFYSVNQLLSNAIPTKIFDGSKPNAFEYPVEWSVHILENGRWIQKEENDKTGNKVSYTFIQKSLERKGIRILAKRGNQVARLDIKPHKAESPKIESIEFLDRNGNKPIKPFAYGQTLKARVHCLHMEKRTVYATLWEDDAAGAGHDKANEKNKMKTLPGTVKGGIADIDFVLEPDFAKIANAIKAKGDADEGKTHEYYVTAEILNKKTASKNTNVANPNYKDTTTTTTKPAAPKKETPAQKKGPSKKQEKEKEKEKSIGDGIIDWLEGILKVNPIVAPNPEAPTGNNPLKTGESGKNPKDDKKDDKKSACPNCDKPVTAEELKKIFTDADSATLQKAADAYTKYMKDLGMNTCWNKAHFFAQAVVESGLKLKAKEGENFNWYYQGLIDTFKAFRTEQGKINAKKWGRAIKDRKDPKAVDVSLENQKNIANWAYSPDSLKGKELGNTQENDGWDFRGKGVIQLTGRSAYEYANTYTKKEGADIITHSDLVATDISIAVLSSMAFWKWKKISDLTDGNSNTKSVSLKVGSDIDGSHDKKQKAFSNSTSTTFKTGQCEFKKGNKTPATGTVTIRLVRKWQTTISTIGEFTIDGSDIKGYFLEEKGPDTTVSGLEQRIPIGTYNLKWHNGTKQKGVLKLYNNSVSEARAILIHSGNKAADTEGCLLAGSSKSTDYVGGSKDKLKEINDYVTLKGIDGAKIIITANYE